MVKGYNEVVKQVEALGSRSGKTSKLVRKHHCVSQNLGMCCFASQRNTLMSSELRGALKCDLSKNLVFCPNQVDPLPVSWDTQN